MTMNTENAEPAEYIGSASSASSALNVVSMFRNGDAALQDRSTAVLAAPPRCALSVVIASREA